MEFNKDNIVKLLRIATDKNKIKWINKGYQYETTVSSWQVKMSHKLDFQNKNNLKFIFIRVCPLDQHRREVSYAYSTTSAFNLYDLVSKIANDHIMGDQEITGTLLCNNLEQLI